MWDFQTWTFYALLRGSPRQTTGPSQHRHMYMDSGPMVGWRVTVFLLCFPMLLLLLSHFSRVWLCATHRRQPTRLPRPWDSPGKNTGVGCHFLLQCMKVKSESEVAQSCLTPSDLMDCSLPGSSAHGIFQARVLEWGAIFPITLLPGSFYKFRNKS